VLLLDNRYVAGSSTPISSLDAEGNSYQLRTLGAAQVRVLKNFPSETELHGRLAPHCAQFSYTELDYYWLVEYRLT
jgi:demethylmenaquinone methyltransferase/2-methoxy-6-polyprenyl-1,4-benzoquinol methylase